MNQQIITNFNNLAVHVEHVLKEVADFAQKAGKSAPQVIAASKTRGEEEILAAKKAGIVHFGENYVKEAEAKTSAFSGIKVHLIGHLQSNKAKIVARMFDVFHGLDSIKLAKALDKACASEGRKMEVLIQVNLAEERQKSGVSEHQLGELVEYVRGECSNIYLVGLMILPPFDEDPRPYFDRLAKLADTYGLAELSMGMSGDWKEAIEAGATYIRLGTSLFGARG